VHGLILAGGEGSRLAREGVTEPKVTVPIAGRSQLVRLVEAMARGGCESVTVLVRRHVTGASALLEGIAAPVPVHVEACETPSSLHTLALGIQRAPAGPLLVVLGDTVMRASDWSAVTRDAHRVIRDDRAGALVVTPYVQDDCPLDVTVGARGLVTEVGGAPDEPRRVTAGIYVLNELLRHTVPAAISAGTTRLRQLLRAWVLSGHLIEALEVSCAIDLDRCEDLLAAEALLSQEIA
jgi:CTP:molybdopterin cytidylyltransferase MocA